MNTTTKESFDMDDLRTEEFVPSGETRAKVEKFLAGIYPDDNDPEIFDSAKAVGIDPEYTIKTTEHLTYDSCETVLTFLHVSLPDDEKAGQLAELLGGEVVDGLHGHPDGKRFRITFRAEIFIDATSEAEARVKFEQIDLFAPDAKSKGAAYVEECSFEEV